MSARRLPAILTFALVAALAACNSAAGTGSPGTSAGTATTPAPTTAGATVGPEASVDVSAATAALAKLKTYKVTMVVTGTSSVNIELVINNAPTAARSIRTTSGSVAIRVIEIGDDVWFDAGTGTFVKGAMPKAQADSMFAAFDLAAMVGGLQQGGVADAMQNMGTEQKNGINAVHLHADEHTVLPAGSSPIPAGATADFWIAVDGGYLVALEAVGFSSATATGDVSIELTNVDDPALIIQPPS
jgi:hypothetical protein